jgi:predicted DCC family thiol-disulfide oxidoreductase YuxK
MPKLLEKNEYVKDAAAQAGRALVLYDGQCPLCIKSAENVKRFDWLHALTVQDARDLDALPQQMHLITPDKKHVCRGFGAFRWIAWRLPLLWPLAPFLYLPGVPVLGEKAYLWIARNRYRLVPCQDGVCHLPPRG